MLYFFFPQNFGFYVTCTWCVLLFPPQNVGFYVTCKWCVLLILIKFLAFTSPAHDVFYLLFFLQIFAFLSPAHDMFFFFNFSSNFGFYVSCTWCVLLSFIFGVEIWTLMLQVILRFILLAFSGILETFHIFLKQTWKIKDIVFSCGN